MNINKQLLFICTCILINSTSTANTQRVSESSSGEQANARSLIQSVSADGRFVAFQSQADNLVENDTNQARDVFVKDRQTNLIKRVSISSSGEQGNDESVWPAISENGRFVVFLSNASNLVPNDTNTGIKHFDVFVHDLDTGITRRVNVSTSGEQTNKPTFQFSRPAISQDGRFVAFLSAATNLVEPDINFHDDVFIHDLTTGTTERVNISSTGEQGNFFADQIILSADGRFVGFSSRASNLVTPDLNAEFIRDVFVHDRQTGITELISVSSDGIQANHHSFAKSISADGRYVAFTSNSSNLVDNDTTLSNRGADVFIRDRLDGTTERVNLSSKGEEANDNRDFFSDTVQLSADGRFVTFMSFASNLALNDTNNEFDIFIHDRDNGTTELVSVGLNNEQSNSYSQYPTLSANGQTVVYTSNATNLVTDELYTFSDVFATTNPIAELSPDLAAKLRDSSGIVGPNDYIRFRVRLTNNSTQTMTNCNAELVNNPVIASLGRPQFNFYSYPLNVTDPQINKPIDIEPGQTGQMNLAIQPRDSFSGELEFRYSCDGKRALALPFVNTAHLTVTTDSIAAADFIQLDTNGRDELVLDRSSGKYWTQFITRVSNPGTEPAIITLNAETVLSPRKLRQAHFCEPVDPTTGDWSCIAPRAEQLQVELSAGETKKIRTFTHANKAISNKAVSHRIYINALDETGEPVAKTSIAVSTLD